MIHRTYTLQIIRPGGEDEKESAFAVQQEANRLDADLPAMIEEFEENLSDLLPGEWEAKIEEWDAPPTEGPMPSIHEESEDV